MLSFHTCCFTPIIIHTSDEKSHVTPISVMTCYICIHIIHVQRDNAHNYRTQYIISLFRWTLYGIHCWGVCVYIGMLALIKCKFDWFATVVVLMSCPKISVHTRVVILGRWLMWLCYYNFQGDVILYTRRSWTTWPVNATLVPVPTPWIKERHIQWHIDMIEMTFLYMYMHVFV